MSSAFTYSVDRPRQNGGQRKAVRIRLKPESEMTEVGTIKWFDVDRRYGFIVPQDGGQDVFLHASVATKYGLRAIEMQKDVVVRFISERRPGLRPEAVAVALVV